MFKVYEEGVFPVGTKGDFSTRDGEENFFLWKEDGESLPSP